MIWILKHTTVLLTVLALIAVPCTACLAGELDQDSDLVGGKMAADGLIVRPLGLCATIIGGAVFLVSLPFSALGGNTKPAYDHLLADPFKFTFNRPLGDF